MTTPAYRDSSGPGDSLGLRDLPPPQPFGKAKNGRCPACGCKESTLYHRSNEDGSCDNWISNCPQHKVVRHNHFKCTRCDHIVVATWWEDDSKKSDPYFHSKIATILFTTGILLMAVGAIMRLILALK